MNLDIGLFYSILKDTVIITGVIIGMKHTISTLKNRMNLVETHIDKLIKEKIISIEDVQINHEARIYNNEEMIKSLIDKNELEKEKGEFLEKTAHLRVTKKITDINKIKNTLSKDIENEQS